MFKRFNDFITPQQSSPLWVRFLPYASLVVLGILAFAVTGAGWEYTNSSEFCGTSCHTMPPEYIAYQHSPHARINCVECHIGRGFVATQFTRKAGDLTHVTRYIGADYEIPIYAKHLRPADQICERCHNPEKFSDSSLREYKRYSTEQNNELSITYLNLKTGGGTAREGQGQGIHWHIENKVEYIATDESHFQQDIPWVRVTYADTGQVKEFIDNEADLPADFVTQNEEEIHEMDCATCHNRVSHLFRTPADALDDALGRGVISPDIPYIKQNAVAVMERQYPSMEEADKAIVGLLAYYRDNWPEYYTVNQGVVEAAVQELLDIYRQIVFPTMDISWETYLNNNGHKNSAGCFRCHDGDHVSQDEAAAPIPLQCNLCHSIPLKNRPDGTSPELTVGDRFEPESHTNPLWLAQHRFSFNETCEGCHTVDNPGGDDNTSFCANSGCHASEWNYTALNTPAVLAQSNHLSAQAPTYPGVDLTWNDLVQPLLAERCIVCHNAETPLDLTNYDNVTNQIGEQTLINYNEPENSLLVTIQQDNHPNRLLPEVLTWLTDWIAAGTP